MMEILLAEPRAPIPSFDGSLESRMGYLAVKDFQYVIRNPEDAFLGSIPNQFTGHDNSCAFLPLIIISKTNRSHRFTNEVDTPFVT
jgi:hypothetical protein